MSKPTKANLRPEWTRGQILAYCERHGFPVPPELLPRVQEPPSARPEEGSAVQIPPKRSRGSILGKRTKVEKEYSLILSRQLQLGEILKFEEQSITLVIGEPQCRYTADFSVWLPGERLKLIEVKGPFAREDSIIKYKSAVRQYPYILFEFWQRSKEGEWSEPFKMT